MQAVLLVGGFGTRLKNITERLDLPKPMVPVLGKSFLEHLLIMLKSKGFTDFVFCTYHQAEKIKDYFEGGSKWGVKIVYSQEESPLFSAGAVKLAENMLEDEFFVINGDDYFPQNYKEMLELHKRKNALITISGKKWQENYRGNYAAFFADKNEKVNSYLAKDMIGSKNPGNAFFAVFLMKKEVISSLPMNIQISLEKDVLPNTVKTGRVYAYISDTPYSEIGTPEKYEEFVEHIRSERI